MKVVSGQLSVDDKEAGAKATSAKIFVWLMATALLPTLFPTPRTYYQTRGKESPAGYPFPEDICKNGGLMSYGADYIDEYRRLAILCRQDTDGNETRRPAYRAADEI